MALDSRFIPLYTLDEPINDKDTGLPLVNGYVTFFEDLQRGVRKDVYKLDEFGGDTYVNIGSQLRTNLAGQIIHNNAPITVYAFPYEGSWEPGESDGTIVRYYIEVTTSVGGAQFTREAVPYIFDSGSSLTAEENFIPNGQFIMHNDYGDDGLMPFSAVALEETRVNVAQGGFYFVHDASSAVAPDPELYVTFESFNNYFTDPPEFPRYRVVLEQTTAGGSPGTFRDLRVQFQNVNRFSGDNTYTLYFEGYLPNGGAQQITIYTIKNYGTGGSTELPTSVGAINLTGDWEKHYLSFSFGNNTNKTIINNDSYVEIALRFSIANYKAAFTNFMLVQGESSSASYPIITTTQDIYRGAAGSLPVPIDGDWRPYLYLPIIFTSNGMNFDSGQIGNIEIVSYETVPVDANSIPITNRLINDGSSYDAEDYSALNIPYSRLRDKLYNSTLKVLRYGTGKDFVTANILQDNELFILNNTGGVVTVSDVGTTGFALSTITTGITAIPIKAALQSANTIVCINNVIGTYTTWVATPGGGDPGTVDELRHSAIVSGVNTLTMAAGSGVTAASHIQCGVPAEDFFVWFNVSGSGTIPAGTGIGIEVKILSTDTAAIVAKKTMAGLTQKQSTMITCNQNASTLNNKYFTFTAKTQASTQLWAVWYNLDGGGTEPVVAGSPNYIEVEILTADSQNEVAEKTSIAINKRMVGVPDPRGLFLRVYDGGASVDPSASTRFDYQNPFLYGDYIGTYEIDGNLTHNHSATSTLSQPNLYQGVGGTGVTGGTSGQSGDVSISTIIAFDGGAESAPRNFFVNTAIIY